MGMTNATKSDAIEAAMEADILLPGPPAMTAMSVWQLLVGAFEGGSNYWYRIDNTKTEYAPGKSRDDFAYLHQVPMFAGCSLLIEEFDERTGEYAPTKFRLNRERIVEGMKIMAQKYRHCFAEFVSEGYDANTSDVFLQCCVLGEVVYG